MHRFLVVGVAALAALALSAPAGAWTWPADGTVLRPFALGSDPYAGGQHRGVDVAGPEGAAIRAPAAGTVTFAGSLPTHGRGVTIQTADGFAVTLVHLGAIAVEKGASVDEGSSIGTMGWSGTPEHAVPSVHLGIRRASDADAYVDPLGLLPPRAAPVPAPTPAPARPPRRPPPSARRVAAPTTGCARSVDGASTGASADVRARRPGATCGQRGDTRSGQRSDRRELACDVPRSRRVVDGPGRGAPRGQPGLTISATSVPHRRPPAAIDPAGAGPTSAEPVCRARRCRPPRPRRGGESVPVGAAKRCATGPGDVSVPGRASPAARATLPHGRDPTSVGVRGPRFARPDRANRPGCASPCIVRPAGRRSRPAERHARSATAARPSARSWRRSSSDASRSGRDPERRP